jgi:exosortase
MLAGGALVPVLHRAATRPELILLVACLGALLIPTILSLAAEHWSTENGAHGPIIFVSGVWLLWREREHIRFRPGSISDKWLLLLAPLLLAYVYARAVGMLGTETTVVYLLLVLLGLFYWGPGVMRRLWFPIIYLAFLIKPPYGLVAEMTQPLKIAISGASVEILYAVGYPIAGSGVLIQVAQYELLVKQACAGLGSLVTLMALGLLYVHLTQPSSRGRNLALILSIIPIALLANLLRVIILVLLTYHFGDAVAQSFAHDLAGIVTFALSMLGLVAFDHLLSRRVPRS